MILALQKTRMNSLTSSFIKPSKVQRSHKSSTLITKVTSFSTNSLVFIQPSLLNKKRKCKQRDLSKKKIIARIIAASRHDFSFSFHINTVPGE